MSSAQGRKRTRFVVVAAVVAALGLVIGATAWGSPSATRAEPLPPSLCQPLIYGGQGEPDIILP